MYGFHPEKFKDQPKGDAPKLGFKPRKSAPAEAAVSELPSSAAPGRGFRPGMLEEMAAPPSVGLGFRPGMNIPVTSDVMPGLGFKPFNDAVRAQAQNQAPDSIPAMVKPGEFVLPPDTVHAMGGAEALQGVVDATHTPAPEAAIVPRGFKPRAYFADGGMADDDWNKPTMPYREQMRNVGQAIANIPKHIVSAPGYGFNSDMKPPSPPTAPAAAPVASNPTDQRLAAGTQTTPAAAPVPTPSAAAVSAPASSSGNVTRVGNSYSSTNVTGDITVNGQAPAGGFMVAGAPQARGFRPGMGAAATTPGPGLGFRPGMGSVAPAVGTGLGFRPGMGAADALAASQQAESMGRLMASGQIAAPAAGPSLIMSGNTGFRRDSRFLAQELGAQRALDRAQGRDPASLRRSAELQRTAMEQQGANQRNLWQYALDQQRINQQGEAQGYTNRTNRLVEAARNQVAAEQDPARRRSLVQYMRDIEGQASGPRWKTSVVPGGVDANGQKLPGYGLLTDETTGESRVIQPGQAATQYEAGKVYVNASGARAKWNGSSWEPA